MSFTSFLAQRVANLARRKIQANAQEALLNQAATMHELVAVAKNTAFGFDKDFDAITYYESFKSKVPVNDYEGTKSYFDRIANGEENVCWPGKPLYLAKTSGTTSGTKYIPITKDSIGNHINSARNALLEYIALSKKPHFINGKVMFLSGSPTLDKKAGIFTGRLSGISNHHIPSYLKGKQMPTWETNCIEDWEEKVRKIAEETHGADLRLISGIPPWVQMYFDLIQEKSNGQTMLEVFPNLQLFVYGGVNFEPYKQKLFQSIGREIDSIETYPASEGFIAYQDDYRSPGLRLLTEDGIFFEFIKADEYHNEDPTRVWLKDVQLNVNYAVIINSNAGLWGYSIGDTVKFSSLNPYKLLVTGRIKHFISAFGEHVIGEEVEHALMTTLKETNYKIIEFTVAPQVSPANGLPYHEWFISFENVPEAADLELLAQKIDRALQTKNSYYKDLITGSVLRTLVITPLQSNAFIEYMKEEGKLGGQNKVPRLANDRKIADRIAHYSIRL
ncbi:MAG: hypothetical protein ACI83I_001511 [Bacteroidia bacterium]|jgi:hypothetical protein